MNKEINKKTAFWVIGLFIVIVAAFLLNVNVCAPCTYRYNNSDYNGVCDRMCVNTPIWKILVFILTGKNIDFKIVPNIMPPKLIQK